MNKTIILVAAAALAVTILAGIIYLVWYKRSAKGLKVDYFQQKWQELQKLLKDKAMWAEAVLDADKLLDEALKKKRIKGRSMGERLVKAQRLFSDNDSLWFGHKLRNKIDAQPDTKLKQKEVKQALVGIRQGLKDLGALE